MKILSISTDRKIFEEGSAVLARQMKYTRLFERLDIIIFSLRTLKLKAISYKPKANLNVYPTSSFSRFLYFLDAFMVARSLEKPDLVTAQDPFESGLAAFLISRYVGAPLHLQIHTDFLSPYFFQESFINKIRFYLARFLIKRARAVRVVSERIKQSIVRSGLKDSTSIKVLPIFVDIEKIKSSPIKNDLHSKYTQFDFIILIAARITKEKNIEMAIDVMTQVIKSHPRVGLLIVGDGSESEKLKAKSEGFKIKDNIMWEGWSDDLTSYYKTADLFLLTSNYEGYGMTVVEALAVGLPVIMTNVGCAGELLIDRVNGLITPVGDLEAMILALEHFLDDPILRESIKININKPVSILTEGEYLKGYKNSLTL